MTVLFWKKQTNSGVVDKRQKYIIIQVYMCISLFWRPAALS